jgi:hypothetical protein
MTKKIYSKKTKGMHALLAFATLVTGGLLSGVDSVPNYVSHPILLLGFIYMVLFASLFHNKD